MKNENISFYQKAKVESQVHKCNKELCKTKNTVLFKMKQLGSLENRLDSFNATNHNISPSLFILIGLSAFKGVKSIILKGKLLFENLSFCSFLNNCFFSSFQVVFVKLVPFLV